MADLHADTGRPMPAEIRSDPDPRFHELPTTARQISLRNTGVNTLWVSFDKKAWFDVACGTSWDDRVNVPGLWHCTQIGRTTFVVNALALNHLGVSSLLDTPRPER